MKTLIVYYSLGGNTDDAVRAVAARLDADLLRLQPVKPYPATGFSRFLVGGASAVTRELPPLKPYTFDENRYQRVMFGTPVWAGNITPPLRTFIHENRDKLRGKTCAALLCQSGAGGNRALARLREALGAEALEAEVVLIDPKDRPSPENARKIEEFCQKLGGQGRRA